MVEQIVKEALSELNEQLDESEQLTYNKEMRLIGTSSELDSMSFVTFVTILEELLEDELNKTIKLVSDKAFSRENSPFYSIRTLESFIEELMKEGQE